MAKRNKILDRILRGTSDTNINFTDLCHLLILLDSTKEFEEIITSLQKMALSKY